MKAPFALIVLALLSGCGHSPPTHFFTLDPVRSSHAPSPLASPVRVDVVHIPPELDRLSMVRESGIGELDIKAENRWGGPLSDLIRQALSEDLAARLSPRSVIFPGAPSPPGCRTIALDILTFQPDASGTVSLVGGWSLVDGNSDKVLVRKPIRLTSDSAALAPDAQAAAMSRLLGQLADEIASDLPAEGATAPRK